MTYSVKEIFYTLQGEGGQAGRAAVFCRFAGCNLWSGREEDRATAVCSFCDTDFVGTNGLGGGKFSSAQALAAAVAALWPAGAVGAATAATAAGLAGAASLAGADRAAGANGRPLVVCTGGEPLLQLDTPLVEALHAQGFEIAVETNGTQAAPPGLDWICVSPKANAALVLTSGSELKLVYPQPTALPQRFEHLNFKHFFLQPMDGPAHEVNTQQTVAYCLAHPQWRLSLQTHKVIGIA